MLVRSQYDPKGERPTLWGLGNRARATAVSLGLKRALTESWQTPPHYTDSPLSLQFLLETDGLVGIERASVRTSPLRLLRLT